jgi:hypothetical protein
VVDVDEAIASAGVVVDVDISYEGEDGDEGNEGEDFGEYPAPDGDDGDEEDDDDGADGAGADDEFDPDEVPDRERDSHLAGVPPLVVMSARRLRHASFRARPEPPEFSQMSSSMAAIALVAQPAAVARHSSRGSHKSSFIVADVGVTALEATRRSVASGLSVAAFPADAAVIPNPAAASAALANPALFPKPNSARPSFAGPPPPPTAPIRTSRRGSVESPPLSVRRGDGPSAAPPPPPPPPPPAMATIPSPVAEASSPEVELERAKYAVANV